MCVWHFPVARRMALWRFRHEGTTLDSSESANRVAGQLEMPDSMLVAQPRQRVRCNRRGQLFHYLKHERQTVKNLEFADQQERRKESVTCLCSMDLRRTIRVTSVVVGRLRVARQSRGSYRETEVRPDLDEGVWPLVALN